MSSLIDELENNVKEYEKKESVKNKRYEEKVKKNTEKFCEKILKKIKKESLKGYTYIEVDIKYKNIKLGIARKYFEDKGLDFSYHSNFNNCNNREYIAIMWC